MKVSLFRLLIVTTCNLFLFAGLAGSGISAQPPLPDRVDVLESGSITGTVTSFAGDGLPYIEIRVYGYNGSTWLEVIRVWTNAAGFYDVAGLEAGVYRVRFWDWSGVYGYEYYDNAPDLNSATDIVVSAGGVTSNIDAVLDAAGSMSGRVSRPDGEPLAGIEVEVYRNDGGNWALVRRDYSNSLGFYTIAGLSAGVYRVRFLDPVGIFGTEYYDNVADIDNATDVVIAPPETSSGIDAVLEGFYRSYLPFIIR